MTANVASLSCVCVRQRQQHMTTSATKDVRILWAKLQASLNSNASINRNSMKMGGSSDPLSLRMSDILSASITHTSILFSIKTRKSLHHDHTVACLMLAFGAQSSFLYTNSVNPCHLWVMAKCAEARACHESALLKVVPSSYVP